MKREYIKPAVAIETMVISKLLAFSNPEITIDPDLEFDEGDAKFIGGIDGIDED